MQGSEGTGKVLILQCLKFNKFDGLKLLYTLVLVY